MIFRELALAGVYEIALEPRGDERGFFARIFCRGEFAEQGLASCWVQINTTWTQKAGTLRGFHFQRPPMAEDKLVKCVRGSIFDVTVDLRIGSATYGQWVGETLSEQNRSMMYIPKGCAHGFLTLTPDVELLYCHSAVYAPALEGGVRYDDPQIGVDWPVAVVTAVSERDAQLPLLRDIEGIVI